MFAEIRNRLTLLYSSIMMVFLLSFVVASFAGLAWVLYQEEQETVLSFAEEEAAEHVMILYQRWLLSKQVFNEEYNSDRKIFFYGYDLNGQLISQSQPPSEMREEVLNKINKWNAVDGKVKFFKHYMSNGDRSLFLLTSIEINDGQNTLGRLFVGRDLTSYYEMLKTILLVLIGVAFLFLIIATLIGHILAGRAIIPLKQSFLRQREFVADASHELRTPLSVMLTSVDAVQTDDKNNLSFFSVQVLDDMKSEIKRMSKIVSDMLTLARADAGAENIIRENFSLYALADSVVRSFKPVTIDKKIDLSYAGVGNLAIYADKERIKQLLYILLDNAIKYTPAGGRIMLSVKVIQDVKSVVTIIVQDTGCGIAKEQQARIFERFYRVDKVRTREEGGTGLGLSIAKWIVEAHGGKIKVESTVGSGSSFIVTLPIGS